MDYTEKLWIAHNGYSLAECVSIESPEKLTTVAVMDGFQIEEDLIKLASLSDPVLLHNLRERYDEDSIYTNLGPMVLSVNPFKDLGYLYVDEIMQQYASQDPETLPPHLFQTAQSALRALVEFRKSQAIVISGESGSGKTEAAKIVLKYLTTIGQDSASNRALGTAITATNSILEAFGNAKTIRNDNSSRFGKLIKMDYCEDGQIVGASLKNYLLESTRVVFQAPGERNYHIFYKMLAGFSASQKTRYSMTRSINSYHYLTGGAVTLDGADEAEDFEVLLDGFQQIGINADEVDQYFRVVAAVLNLGNIEFSGESQVKIVNLSQVQIVADLLKVSPSLLQQSLTVRMLQSGGRQSSYMVHLTNQQAIENRDSMAKLLYSRLFDTLIQRINQRLVGKVSPISIFILDIYGFENFETNSLEQLCINYANEKLHSQFLSQIFISEQTEYQKEGVPWDHIKFVDNSSCIRLIEGAIFDLINEEVRLPQGSDQDMIFKLVKQHSSNPSFKYNRLRKNQFQINHYAGPVAYSISGFLEKNRNTRNISFDSVIGESLLELVQGLIEQKEQKVLNNSRMSRLTETKSTILQGFKNDLSLLCDLLDSSTRHYVRCFKPNNSKIANCFDGAKILDQLRCNGILDTVIVRKRGYSYHLNFPDVVSRYFVLDPNLMPTPRSLQSLLSRCRLDDRWFIGKTKLFLSVKAFQDLENKRIQAKTDMIITTQSRIRGAHAAGELASRRKVFIALRKIQSQVRRYNAEVRFAELRHVFQMLLRLQTRVRMLRDRRILDGLQKEAKVKDAAATVLQSYFLSYWAKYDFDYLRQVEQQRLLEAEIQNVILQEIENERLERENDHEIRLREEEQKRREEEEIQRRAEEKRLREAKRRKAEEKRLRDDSPNVNTLATLGRERTGNFMTKGPSENVLVKRSSRNWGSREQSPDKSPEHSPLPDLIKRKSIGMSRRPMLEQLQTQSSETNLKSESEHSLSSSDGLKVGRSISSEEVSKNLGLLSLDSPTSEKRKKITRKKSSDKVKIIRAVSKETLVSKKITRETTPPPLEMSEVITIPSGKVKTKKGGTLRQQEEALKRVRLNLEIHDDPSSSISNEVSPPHSASSSAPKGLTIRPRFKSGRPNADQVVTPTNSEPKKEAPPGSISLSDLKLLLSNREFISFSFPNAKGIQQYLVLSNTYNSKILWILEKTPEKLDFLDFAANGRAVDLTTSFFWIEENVLFLASQVLPEEYSFVGTNKKEIENFFNVLKQTAKELHSYESRFSLGLGVIEKDGWVRIAGKLVHARLRGSVIAWYQKSLNVEFDDSILVGVANLQGAFIANGGIQIFIKTSFGKKVLVKAVSFAETEDWYILMKAATESSVSLTNQLSKERMSNELQRRFGITSEVTRYLKTYEGAEPSGKLISSGWVSKLTSERRKQRQFMEIRNGNLYLYDSEKKEQSKIEICLVGCQAIAIDQSDFILTEMNTGRESLWSGSTSAEMESWIFSLNYHSQLNTKQFEESYLCNQWVTVSGVRKWVVITKKSLFLWFSQQPPCHTISTATADGSISLVHCKVEVNETKLSIHLISPKAEFLFQPYKLDALKTISSHLLKCAQSQVILILNIQSQIGRACCKVFPSCSRIVGTYRPGEKIRSFSEKLKAQGHLIELREVDLNEDSSLVSLYTYMISSFGRVDVLLNLIDDPPAKETDVLKSMTDLVSSNSFLPYRVSQMFTALMKTNGFGRIINLSDPVGFPKNIDKNSSISYAISKAAIPVLTKVLACSVPSGANVLINCVNPGFQRDKPQHQHLPVETTDWRSAGQVAEDIFYLATLPSNGLNGETVFNKEPML